MDILVKYWILINILTVLIFAIDKLKARMNRWRIRESVLLGLSFIGGAVGGLFSMYICHHKTQKKRFSIGLPMMVILHIIVAAVLWQKLNN